MLSHSKKFSSLLLANVRQGSLARSVPSRRKDFYDSPEWQNLDPVTLGSDVGLRLPALLERHDNLDLRASLALQDVDALLSD